MGGGFRGLIENMGACTAYLPFPTFLRAWNRLIRAENFQKLFEAADEDVNFSHQRLVDLLTLSAAKGGTQEFANALRLVVKEGGVKTGCLVMELEWISLIFGREVFLCFRRTAAVLSQSFFQILDSIWTVDTIARTMRNLTWKSSTRFWTCCWCESPLHGPWCVCFWILQCKNPKIWYLWCLPPLALDEVQKSPWLTCFATACCLIAEDERSQSLVVGPGGLSTLPPSASHIQANTMNSQNVKSWWSSSMVVKLWARKRMHWISFGLCKRCRLRSFCRKWRFQLQALETLAADFTTLFVWCCKFCFCLFLWGSWNDVMTAQRVDRDLSVGHRERGFES